MLKVFFISQFAHLSYCPSQWLKALLMLTKSEHTGLEQDLETEMRHQFSSCDATFTYRMLVVTKFILALEKPRKQNLREVQGKLQMLQYSLFSYHILFQLKTLLSRKEINCL